MKNNRKTKHLQAAVSFIFWVASMFTSASALAQDTTDSYNTPPDTASIIGGNSGTVTGPTTPSFPAAPQIGTQSPQNNLSTPTYPNTTTTGNTPTAPSTNTITPYGYPYYGQQPNIATGNTGTPGTTLNGTTNGVNAPTVTPGNQAGTAPSTTSP